jgi:hypothetical protein
MPCEPIDFPDGSFGIICVRGSPAGRRRCVGCRRFVADRLCDIPVPGQPPGAERATCSAPVCSRCTVRLGDDDICPAHPVPAEALRCARIPARARR